MPRVLHQARVEGWEGRVLRSFGGSFDIGAESRPLILQRPTRFPSPEICIRRCDLAATKFRSKTTDRILAIGARQQHDYA